MSTQVDKVQSTNCLRGGREWSKITKLCLCKMWMPPYQDSWRALFSLTMLQHIGFYQVHLYKIPEFLTLDTHKSEKIAIILMASYHAQSNQALVAKSAMLFGCCLKRTLMSFFIFFWLISRRKKKEISCSICIQNW